MPELVNKTTRVVVLADHQPGACIDCGSSLVDRASHGFHGPALNFLRAQLLAVSSFRLICEQSALLARTCGNSLDGHHRRGPGSNRDGSTALDHCGSALPRKRDPVHYPTLVSGSARLLPLYENTPVFRTLRATFWAGGSAERQKNTSPYPIS